MTTKHLNILYVLSFILVLSACSKDKEDAIMIEGIDLELANALQEASEGKGLAHFRLPKSNEFNNIPQDPKNKLT